VASELQAMYKKQITSRHACYLQILHFQVPQSSEEPLTQSCLLLVKRYLCWHVKTFKLNNSTKITIRFSLFGFVIIHKISDTSTVFAFTCRRWLYFLQKFDQTIYNLIRFLS